MKKIIFFIICLSSIGVARSQKWPLDSDNSAIVYNAKHIAHAWEGTNDKLQGLAVLDGEVPKQIAIKAAIRDFDSNNANRDSHALEVLEALRFPDVRFYSKSIRLMESQMMEMDGVIVFHGRDVPKKVMATFNKTAVGFQLTGTFEFLATDFGIKLPSFMLVKINDMIRINFDVTFVQP